MAYLYRHIRLDKNEVFYVGIGSDTNYSRSKAKIGRNKIWKSITNKSPYEVEIILDGLSWEEACKKEVEFINLYGRRDLGNGTLVNLTNGGEGTLGTIRGEQWKEKQSKSHKGRKCKPWSEEHRRNHREAQIIKREIEMGARAYEIAVKMGLYED